VTRPPIFLVGAQRSGTTALAHAISQAVNSQTGGTFTVNGKLWYLLDRWLDASDLEARHLRTDEIIHALRRRPAQGAGSAEWLARAESALRVAAGEVGAGVWSPDQDGVLGLRRWLAHSIAGSQYWGDKYNEYLLHMPELEQTFPDARWIMVYRHPGEVSASMLAWAGDRPYNPVSAEHAEAKWVAWNRRWLEARSRIERHRWVEVDYADLCDGAGSKLLADITDLDLSTALAQFSSRRPRPDDAMIGPEARLIWDQLSGSDRS